MTCNLLVEFIVWTDDVDVAKSEAERLLPDLLDGTDFSVFSVIEATKNEE